MSNRIRDQITMLLLVIAAVTVLWFVLSRMHFVVFVGTSIWGLILTILGGIIVLFLVLDHFFNRSR